MEIQMPAIDVTERELARIQLDELAVANQGQAWHAWKDAVVEWHVRAIASARAEAWIPGLAGPQEPLVEEVLSRFYRYHISQVIKKLRTENLKLRHKLHRAIQCTRYYATGARDGGERARCAVEELLEMSASGRYAKRSA